MNKITLYDEPDGIKYAWFFCPGCETNHRIPVTGPRKWEYNQLPESPTFHPSIKTTWHKTKDGGTSRVVDENGKDVMHVCHSFVRDGKIQYLDDCTHALRGQTVELPDTD